MFLGDFWVFFFWVVIVWLLLDLIRNLDVFFFGWVVEIFLGG